MLVNERSSNHEPYQEADHDPKRLLEPRGGGGGGGGGGTQIWFRRGCAAEAAKPVPIFKGHFGGKGYPLLGLFISRKLCFFVL